MVAGVAYQPGADRLSGRVMDTDTGGLVAVAAIGLFVTPIGAAATWLVNRRTRHRQDESAAVEARGAALEAVMSSLDRLTEDVKRTRDQLTEVEAENELLRTDIRDLRTELHELREDRL